MIINPGSNKNWTDFPRGYFPRKGRVSVKKRIEANNKWSKAKRGILVFLSYEFRFIDSLSTEEELMFTQFQG